MHRSKTGPKTLTAFEVNSALDELGVDWRAMAYLGINCGFGNNDCDHLLIEDVNFDDGLVTAIRNKTGELRVATLWPETVDALQLSYSRRVASTTKDSKGRFFTLKGECLIDESKNETDIIGKRFSQALHRLMMHVPGTPFYWFRHTFRTVADKIGDETAIRWVLGHVDDRIDKTYIHDAPVERIRKVTDHVHDWLKAG